MGLSGAYIGIDPGGKGGLACISPRGVSVLSLGGLGWDTVWNWLDYQAKKWGRSCKVGIERVTGYVAPRTDKEREYEGNRQPGHMMFKFGTSYGYLCGMLVVMKNLYKIETDTIAPKSWQHHLPLPPRKQNETDVKWKGRLKGMAQRLYPFTKVINSTADALLIAHYLREQYE